MKEQSTAETAQVIIDNIKSKLTAKTNVFEGGNIKNHLRDWEKLTSDETVLTTVSSIPVENECMIPLESFRESYFSSEEELFLDLEIKKLLKRKRL